MKSFSSNQFLRIIICIGLISSFYSCDEHPNMQVDMLVINGTIVDGSGDKLFNADLAIKDSIIVFIGTRDTINISAKNTIDASGLVVAPGFIDPHTHSLGDLRSPDRNANLNYLTQGVTTVVNGNDGDGPYDIHSVERQLSVNGIGTNTAFFVGHGTVRGEVIGGEARAPNSFELENMKSLIKQSMEQGALGFSTGLYYAPGSYATTDEVIELTKEVKPFAGLYDSHIRDESTYNIGLIAAVKEAIRIGEEAGVAVHLAHIKALGIDVWGQSQEIIHIVEEAHIRGVKVTADQYPWLASGTHLGNAVISRWVMAGGKADYYARLNDKKLLPRIKEEIKENIRKRGGAESLLITADVQDQTMIGKTLLQISDSLQRDPVETALLIARNGGARVASFNMNENDLMNFMKQPWVMTSSDGTKGHPRKYASYPQKYYEYVKKKEILSLQEFVHRSSGLVAETFDLPRRGKLLEGYFADLIIFEPNSFMPKANFYQPAELTLGIDYLFVNGQLTIDNGLYTEVLAGRVLKKGERQVARPL